MAQLNGAANLFVALWPDAALRDALRAEQARWHWPRGAAPTPADKLHLTLHFIGPASAERTQALADGLALRTPPIALVLDQRETWGNGCAVLMPSVLPAGLCALHDALGRSLQGLGVVLETRTFRPHVTLARRARGAAPPTEAPALRWRADTVALVRSHAGRYAVLGGGAQ